MTNTNQTKNINTRNSLELITLDVDLDSLNEGDRLCFGDGFAPQLIVTKKPLGKNSNESYELTTLSRRIYRSCEVCQYISMPQLKSYGNFIFETDKKIISSENKKFSEAHNKLLEAGM
ncbi:MAG: hypothetical protein WCX73_05535 [Candidatus Pacearchaeota archaeon]|jgi:hypothetical protein